ncbi:MAG: hypothetical protein HC923_03655 [Myxococcales bacterium]|nr:hypothetical protein [Myxococcales bacterium]
MAARNSNRKVLATPTHTQHTTFERTDSDVRTIERQENFAVTCAQNNTAPIPGFLEALKHWCDERNGALLIRPVRYKNPTSKRDPQDERDEDYWWDSAVEPFLIDNEVRLHRELVLPKTRIQVTSPSLTSRLDSRSKGASAIYGHTRLSMHTVATPHNKLPKIIYSTGAVTQKNYSTTLAGDLAEFHHSPSAVLVELRGDRSHLREVTWDGEAFYDLDRKYTAKGGEDAERLLALVTGDEHVWFHEPAVRRATYDDLDSIVATLRPEELIRHDVLDCYSVSPHHFKRRLTRAVKTITGWGNLERELEDTLRFIEATTPDTATNVFAASNHHDHLTQWLQSGEQHVEPENLKLYHWLNYKMLEQATWTDSGVYYPSPLRLFAEERGYLTHNAKWLGPDDSHVVAGVELGMHGHLGPDGARGSIRNLSRVGLRSVIAHRHSPGIFEGTYQVGTSSRLRLEYTSGPSSWLHTHAGIHRNGRRQMIHVIDGAWRG